IYALMKFAAGAFGRIPFAARLAGRLMGEPLGLLGWKPFARRQLVYDLPYRRLALVNDPATVERLMLDRASEYPKSAIVHDLLAPLIGAGVFGQPGGNTGKEARRFIARSLAGIDPGFIAEKSRSIALGYIRRWLDAPGRPI